MFTKAELQAALQNFESMQALMQRFKASLNLRDRLILEVGLRSAHLEEALAQGEAERARSHLLRLLQVVQKL
jgi:hypothetical protein